VAFKQSVRRTQNVVAVWPGSDPKLKGEYVAVGAHYDHVGVRNVPEGQDGLYNGADDDGSGTVALLEMAEVFASNPKPKRSILFVWHSGEEKGLWGSGHFTDNPTVPIGQIVAQINIDMIGRSRTAADTPERFPQMTGPDEVHVVGSRMISDELGDVLVSVNSKLHKLTFNAHYDRPNDPERIYFRSDHYNYARKGIPIAFFFSGIHADYHGVDDEVDRIDFRKLERVTETVYATLWELATRAGRPKPKAGASQ
jgi:Zn-dependent M28 family amino/carboxypeptidase